MTNITWKDQPEVGASLAHTENYFMRVTDCGDHYAWCVEMGGSTCYGNADSMDEGKCLAEEALHDMEQWFR